MRNNAGVATGTVSLRDLQVSFEGSPETRSFPRTERVSLLCCHRRVQYTFSGYRNFAIYAT
jgi:hypothetical protein